MNCMNIRTIDYVGLIHFAYSPLDLEELILKGVSQGITDVTAFHGFNRLRKLKMLGIFGDNRITDVGRQYLQTKLPESKACILYIT
jgi:hypothetical protein